MSAETRATLQAIDRWEHNALIDADVAALLRGEVAQTAEVTTKRLSQYVLASTGAIVLVIAGALFLNWAWPLLGEGARVHVLGAIGVGVMSFGARLEGSHKWRPTSYLMQIAGLSFLLSTAIYSKQAWDDVTFGGFVMGGLSLAVPIVLAPRALRRDVVMPAIYLAFDLAFFAVFLDRATTLSATGIAWTVDAVLLVAILGLVRLLVLDPEGERHPWVLNAFVMALFAGFVMIAWTSLETFDTQANVMVPLDFWLALILALTLWGIHWGPPALKRENFGRMLAYLVLIWIPFGFTTAFWTLEGGSGLALVLVGGAGVMGFLYARRFALRELMTTSMVAFIIALWVWAVTAAGVLGAVAALVATAGILFWISGRTGGPEEVPTDTLASG